ncbi:PDDEXK nuclease domain-containing protein [Hymenobacter sp. BT559]|nr:PDDEXK nuclease domain-containing protein [Hymenobacter sp. BT559]
MAVDELRHLEDQPSIGLLLCKNKNRVVAEHAVRDVHKTIGVAE